MTEDDPSILGVSTQKTKDTSNKNRRKEDKTGQSPPQFLISGPLILLNTTNTISTTESNKGLCTACYGLDTIMKCFTHSNKFPHKLVLFSPILEMRKLKHKG